MAVAAGSASPSPPPWLRGKDEAGRNCEGSAASSTVVARPLWGQAVLVPRVELSGVKVTVEPMVRDRQGLGGWMLMMTIVGTPSRVGGPGGERMVSMFTVPADAVAMETRV